MADDSGMTLEPGDLIDQIVWDLSRRKQCVKRRLGSRQLRRMVGGMLEQEVTDRRFCRL